MKKLDVIKELIIKAMKRGEERCLTEYEQALLNLIVANIESYGIEVAMKAFQEKFKASAKPRVRDITLDKEAF